MTANPPAEHLLNEYSLVDLDKQLFDNMAARIRLQKRERDPAVHGQLLPPGPPMLKRTWGMITASISSRSRPRAISRLMTVGASIPSTIRRISVSVAGGATPSQSPI